MPYKSGNFQNRSAVAVFVDLILDKATGRLSCRQGGQQKDIWFVEGVPVWTSSNQVHESLLRLCVRWKVINQDESVTFLASCKEEGRRSGEVLVTNGKIDTDGLKKLLVRQGLTRGATLLAWQRGTYAFYEDDDPPQKITISRLRMLAQSVGLRFDRESFDQFKINLASRPIALDKERMSHLESELNAHPNVRKLLAVFSDSIHPASDGIEVLLSRLGADRAWQLFVVAYDLGLLAEVSESVGQQPSASVEVKEQEGDLNEELEALYRELSAKNAFEVIGVAEDITDSGVKKAYFLLAKKYHPDRYYDREHNRTNRSAEKLFALISQSFEQIKSASARDEYRNFLSTGMDAEGAVETARKIMESELAFQKAQVLIRRRKYDDAIEELNHAIELNSDEAEYLATLGWVHFIANWPEDPKAAQDGRERIVAAIRMNENDHELHYLLGRTHNIAKDFLKAAKEFSKVLSLNKTHGDAARDLKIVKSKLSTKELQLL